MRDSGTNLSKHERKTQNTGEVSFQMRGEEMSHQFINVEKKGHITILTMNRPGGVECHPPDDQPGDVEGHR